MNGTTGHFVHTWNFRVRGLAPFYKNGFYGLMSYSVVMATIKPLILLEWIHLFASRNSQKSFRWTCYTLGAVNVLMYTISILADATACRPREYWWDRSIPGGHCVNTRDLPIATGTMNAVIDLFILHLPQRIIWRSHMTKQKRIGISLVFALGAISVAAAIARTVLAYLYAESADVAYHFSQAGVFCLVEMTAAILVLTAPTVSKPTFCLPKQAVSSLARLLRSGHRDGSALARSNAYQQHMDEHGHAVPLIKARSSRSNKSSRAGSHGTGDEV
ncbi:hypothetical protein PG985_009943 [Apiospora marii]|uniref:uncharacterized protein n=1 Tax=Apiospora marii TaxID=335849 RepID=UPI00312F4A41